MQNTQGSVELDGCSDYFQRIKYCVHVTTKTAATMTRNARNRTAPECSCALKLAEMAFQRSVDLCTKSANLTPVQQTFLNEQKGRPFKLWLWSLYLNVTVYILVHKYNSLYTVYSIAPHLWNSVK